MLSLSFFQWQTSRDRHAHILSHTLPHSFSHIPECTYAGNHLQQTHRPADPQPPFHWVMLTHPKSYNWAPTIIYTQSPMNAVRLSFSFTLSGRKPRKCNIFAWHTLYEAIQFLFCCTLLFLFVQLKTLTYRDWGWTWTLNEKWEVLQCMMLLCGWSSRRATVLGHQHYLTRPDTFSWHIWNRQTHFGRKH